MPLLSRPALSAVGKLPASVDVPAAAAAGMIAALAYLAEMAIDLRLLDHDADDLALLGGVLAQDRATARRLGVAIHLANGAAAGIAYAALAHGRFPGPPWLRGAIAANIENLGLYPLLALERFHPLIRRGKLGRYWHPVAFAQSVPRHIVFGIVLGELYDRLLLPE